MECPVCKEPLIILEYQDVEVDYCVTCRGVWLDAGELELLFGDRTVTQGFMTAGDSAQASREPLRRCPICAKRMAKHTTGGAAPVLYDRCPRGDGLWFDAGELTTVLQYGSPAPGGEEVARWLREMFPERARASEGSE